MSKHQLCVCVARCVWFGLACLNRDPWWCSWVACIALVQLQLLSQRGPHRPDVDVFYIPSVTCLEKGAEEASPVSLLEMYCRCGGG